MFVPASFQDHRADPLPERARAKLLLFRFDVRHHVLDVLLEFPGVEAVDVTLATDLLSTPDRMNRIGATLPG